MSYKADAKNELLQYISVVIKSHDWELKETMITNDPFTFKLAVIDEGVILCEMMFHLEEILQEIIYWNTYTVVDNRICNIELSSLYLNRHLENEDIEIIQNTKPVLDRISLGQFTFSEFMVAQSLKF